MYEQEKEHKSQWAAITAIASKIGCSAQTLSSWIKRRDIDTGRRSGVTTDEQARVTALEPPFFVETLKRIARGELELMNVG